MSEEYLGLDGQAKLKNTEPISHGFSDKGTHFTEADAQQYHTLVKIEAELIALLRRTRGALRTELSAFRVEVERLRVQLAGCLTAAEGHISDPATKEMFGWSVAYEQVLQLRIRYEAFVAVARAAQNLSENLRWPEQVARGNTRPAGVDELVRALADPDVQAQLREVHDAR